MCHEITTAVIAAAGSGTRMYPATKVLPKELFPVGRLPVIAHIVAEFLEAKIENIVIVAGVHNKAFIAELFDPSGKVPDKLAHDPLVRSFQKNLGRCAISIIEQAGNYGNGTPLRIATEGFNGKPCVYAFGDDIVVGENATQSLINIYRRTGQSVMGAQEVSPTRKSSFGILECEMRDGVHYVSRIVEKPRPGETQSNLASFGRYLVTPAVLEMLRRTKVGRDGEVWFVDAMIAHLGAGGQACVSPLSVGRWCTVGDPKGYAEAVRAATEEQLAAG